MMSNTDPHTHRMQRKKAHIDAQIASATQEKGLLLIHTGNGKGKSSSAFGVLARALGHGMNAAVIQWIKSRTDTGEEAFFSAHAKVRWHVMGDGFTWETQDAERDKASARQAWQLACQYLHNSAIDLLILDEFTYALNYGWLNIEEVKTALNARPAMQHVIITGRAASNELIQMADTVTEMHLSKHAYQAGIQAMRGIEW